MAHQWDRGVLNASSWHGLEEVGTFASAACAVAHGERCGAWPTEVRTAELYTVEGYQARAKAVVGHYQRHDPRVLGSVGGRYRATTPTEWRGLVAAACDAGATPTGAFSLAHGSRVLATFDVGDSNGLRTQLLLADSFDGSTKFLAGMTSIRVVCANTLSAALRQDGGGMAALRHTASLEAKIAALPEAIDAAIKTGCKVRDTFHRAEATRLTYSQAEHVLDQLFPRGDSVAAGSGRGARTSATKLDNARNEALAAAQLAVNNCGQSLATLWNAATYLVDRRADGSARPVRGGGDSLDSLLFGGRAERIAEIQAIIEIAMADGSIERVTAPEAQAMGVDTRQIGASILADMLAST